MSLLAEGSASFEGLRDEMERRHAKLTTDLVSELVTLRNKNLELTHTIDCLRRYGKSSLELTGNTPIERRMREMETEAEAAEGIACQAVKTEAALRAGNSLSLYFFSLSLFSLSLCLPWGSTQWDTGSAS